MTRWIPWWVWLAATMVALVVVSRSDPSVQVGAIVLVAVVAIVRLVYLVRRPRIGDWRDAEHAAARWLRKAGCRRVCMTGAGADGGIDVITAEWAVQVKHTTKRVGRPVVQQLVGAALSLDRQPALFSTSGFTTPAFEYALEHDVALFELDPNGSARRMNRPARRVGTRRRRLLSRR